MDTSNVRNLLLAACLAALAPFVLLSCDKSESTAQSRALRVSSRSQLIGGPTALGEVGDYLIENDQVRVLVQDLTYNRGSGVFGGSLIDADIRRTGGGGDGLGGSGRDNFGELFPAFFLEMIDPQEISIINDGSNGEAAVIEVRGRGGEFVTMLRYLNQLMVNSYEASIDQIAEGIPASSDGTPLMEFSTRYILEPGARHVRIESTMRNVSPSAQDFPSSSILGLLETFLGLDLSDFRIPTGHVLGFGNLSDIFIPGVGYDLRFGLEESYETSVPLPAFPGLLTNLVASTTDLGVNYGFATEDNPDSNFVYQRDQSGLYDGRAKSDDMLFLFYASGFGGVFTGQAPPTLAPSFCRNDDGSAREDVEATCASEFSNPADVAACENEFARCVQSIESVPDAYTFTNYFIIGDGDVASIQEEARRIRGQSAPLIRGRVFDASTRTPLGKRTSVLFYDVDDEECSNARIMSQVHTNSDGFFELELAPGRYCHRVQGDEVGLGTLSFFEVTANGADFLSVRAPSPAQAEVLVMDPSGQPLPAKLTVVGTHEYRPDESTQDFLFDLRAGEPWRASDMIEDEPDDPATRRFIERTAYGDYQGRIRTQFKPGDYTLVVSRGPEYNLFEKQVSVKAGQVARVTAVLERVVDTSGYLSGDFHLHALGSIDSGLDNTVRVHTVAAEGLEVAVSTDHNYVTDYRPYIDNSNLQDWVTSVVGLELTTFEAGHFNAFPVERQISSMNRGSIRWQDVPPAQIFSTLRGMAPENGNIIQVNHPRTPILGYFYQHNVDPFDATVDLAINEADGQLLDRVTAGLTSPSGPAFVDTVVDENGEPIEFKSTFSWDFDAIEVFNGKHLEELRHFRMPYDKTAEPGAEDALPDTVFAGLEEELLAEAKNEEGEFRDSFIRQIFPELTPTERSQLTEQEVGERAETWVFDNIPDKNAVLCDGDDLVFAGGLDDWYNMLNRERPDGIYRAYTATGNSDAHGDYLDEAGYPRNYFYVGHDTPRKMTNQQLVSAIQSHHNIVSNGPFVTMHVNQEPIGSQVEVSTGQVEIDVRIAAADWVGADRFRIVANGEVVRGLTDDQSEDFFGWVPIELVDGTYSERFVVDVDQDTWFVVEVEGDQNLFPVVAPQEIPPFNFDAVIGNLAGAFGFGGGVEGLDPQFTFPFTPFAFTNPVWVIADGDAEFTPPRPDTMRCEDGQFVSPNALLTQSELEAIRKKRLYFEHVPVELHRENPLERPRGVVTRDLRMLFESFGHIH